MNFSFEFVFEHYFKHLFDSYQPIDFVIGVIFVLITVVVGIWKGYKQAFRLLTIGYLLFVMDVTVISRPQNERIYYCLIPFYSYFSIANGDRFLLPQVLMNIVMFVPIGFLFRNWGWMKVLAYGSLLSLLIELLQLALMKGAAEVDDVIHNSLGCMMGYGIYKILKHIRTVKIYEKSVNTYIDI